MSGHRNKMDDATDCSPLSRPCDSDAGGGSKWREVGGEVDLNCDLSESTGNDDLIIPYITSASIACGYHAGNEATMRQTIETCLKCNVAIGAHPSFDDRENFGRTEMNLEKEEVYELVTKQLMIIEKIARSYGTRLRHVKPHGALYNMSARDAGLAGSIAKAVQNFDKELILFGLSGSQSIGEAQAIGLQTASEVFADRTFQDDGTLTPRSQPNALIDQTEKAIAQILQMVKEGTVTTVSGKKIPIIAETICIHGDGKHAVEFAKAIYHAIRG